MMWKAFRVLGGLFHFITLKIQVIMANAQDLTASALLNVQARLNSIFAEGQSTPSKYPFTDHLGSVNALFQNHRASASPINDAVGNCIGYNVYWLNYGDGTLDYDGDGTTPALSLACDLTSGDEPVSNEKIYTNNVIKQKVISIDDDLCGNVFRDPGSNAAEQAETLIANRLAMAMHTLRAGLNAEMISFLNTNFTTVNNDETLPSGLTFASGSGFEIDETVLSMQEPDTLTELEYLAMNNDMNEFFMLCGRKHFASAMRNSDFRRLNDNERDHIRFDNYSMYFDPKNLDSTLSGANTFIVDPGSYIFWNHIRQNLSTTPQPVFGNDYEGFEFFIEDPVLRYLDNGVLRPVRYNVYYQRKCDGVNTTELRRTAKHFWEISFNGGLWVAPPSEVNHTGILKVKSAE